MPPSPVVQMIGMTLVGRLRPGAELHGGGDADGVADVGTDRAVLIGAVHDLTRPEARAARGARSGRCRSRPRRPSSAPSAACRDTGNRRAPWRSPPGARRRCRSTRSGSTRRSDPRTCVRAAAISATHASCVRRGTASASASSAARSQLTMPEIDRDVAPDVLGRLIDADVLRIRSERELADRRHAVLADEDHQVGARQRRRRGVRRQRARVGELPFHRAGLDDRNLRLLGERASARPTPSRRTRRCSTRSSAAARLGSGRRPWRCPSARDAGAPRCDTGCGRGRTRARSASLNFAAATSAGKSRCTGFGTPLLSCRNA